MTDRIHNLPVPEEDVDDHKWLGLLKICLETLENDDDAAEGAIERYKTQRNSRIRSFGKRYKISKARDRYLEKLKAWLKDSNHRDPVDLTGKAITMLQSHIDKIETMRGEGSMPSRSDASVDKQVRPTTLRPLLPRPLQHLTGQNPMPDLTQGLGPHVPPPPRPNRHSYPPHNVSLSHNPLQPAPLGPLLQPAPPPAHQKTQQHALLLPDRGRPPAPLGCSLPRRSIPNEHYGRQQSDSGELRVIDAHGQTLAGRQTDDGRNRKQRRHTQIDLWHPYQRHEAAGARHNAQQTGSGPLTATGRVHDVHSLVPSHHSGYGPVQSSGYGATSANNSSVMTSHHMGSSGYGSRDGSGYVSGYWPVQGSTQVTHTLTGDGHTHTPAAGSASNVGHGFEHASVLFPGHHHDDGTGAGHNLGHSHAAVPDEFYGDYDPWPAPDGYNF